METYMRKLLLASSLFCALTLSCARALILVSGVISVPIGLQLYWPLDTATTTGSVTRNVTGFGVSGTATGATTGIAAQIAEGLTFAGGSSYVEGAGTPVTGYPLQSSAWVKLASTNLASGTDEVIGAVVQKSTVTEFWVSYYTAGGSTADQLMAVAQSGGSLGRAMLQ